MREHLVDDSVDCNLRLLGTSPATEELVDPFVEVQYLFRGHVREAGESAKAEEEELVEHALVPGKAEDGAKIWSADVQNQWFQVNHPVEAPILTFFKRYQKAIKVGNNSWRSDKPSVLLKILDARSGDVLHDGKVDNSYEQSYLMRVTPENRQLEIETRLETVKLEFAEQAAS